MPEITRGLTMYTEEPVYQSLPKPQVLRLKNCNEHESIRASVAQSRQHWTCWTLFTEQIWIKTPQMRSRSTKALLSVAVGCILGSLIGLLFNLREVNCFHNLLLATAFLNDIIYVSTFHSGVLQWCWESMIDYVTLIQIFAQILFSQSQTFVSRFKLFRFSILSWELSRLHSWEAPPQRQFHRPAACTWIAVRILIHM